MAQPKDFGYGEEQEMLKDSARRFMEDKQPLLALRESIKGTEDPYFGENRTGSYDKTACSYGIMLGCVIEYEKTISDARVAAAPFFLRSCYEFFLMLTLTGFLYLAMASKVVAGLPQRLDTLVKQAKARLPVTIVLVALLLVLLVTCVRSRRGGGGARYAAPVDAAPIDEHASFVSVSRRKGRGTSEQGSAGGGAATAAAAAPAQYGGQEVRAAMARLQQSDAATTARFSL